jgi:hypothetical protein
MAKLSTEPDKELVVWVDSKESDDFIDKSLKRNAEIRKYLAKSQAMPDDNLRMPISSKLGN